MTRPFDMDFPRLMFLHSPKMFPTMFIPRSVNRDIIRGDGPFCLVACCFNIQERVGVRRRKSEDVSQGNTNKVLKHA